MKNPNKMHCHIPKLTAKKRRKNTIIANKWVLFTSLKSWNISYWKNAKAKYKWVVLVVNNSFLFWNCYKDDFRFVRLFCSLTLEVSKMRYKFFSSWTNLYGIEFIFIQYYSRQEWQFYRKENTVNVTA